SARGAGSRPFPRLYSGGPLYAEPNRISHRCSDSAHRHHRLCDSLASSVDEGRRKSRGSGPRPLCLYSGVAYPVWHLVRRSRLQLFGWQRWLGIPRRRSSRRIGRGLHLRRSRPSRSDGGEPAVRRLHGSARMARDGIIVDAMRWQRPWLRIELAIRAVLADRMTRGASEKVDRALMTLVEERERIARAGWFD